jgi:hypothetical protein
MREWLELTQRAKPIQSKWSAAQIVRELLHELFLETRAAKTGVESAQIAVSLFWTDSIVMSYADVVAATKWWIMAFDCNAVIIPSDWDDPLPSDVALKLPGREEPTILLGSKCEGGSPSEHPIIFTSKVNKAYEHLRGRGMPAAGVVHKEWGTELFEIVDSEGNVIEICSEP